jgi:hypothetical protein
MPLPELDVPTPGAATRPNDDFGHRPQTPDNAARAVEQTGPFSWQDGRRLWILDGGPNNWVLAELIFDPRSCCYEEVRRSSYRWPREAAGALLGRTLASGRQRTEDAARELTAWSRRGISTE